MRIFVDADACPVVDIYGRVVMEKIVVKQWKICMCMEWCEADQV